MHMRHLWEHQFWEVQFKKNSFLLGPLHLGSERSSLGDPGRDLSFGVGAGVSSGKASRETVRPRSTEGSGVCCPLPVAVGSSASWRARRSAFSGPS